MCLTSWSQPCSTAPPVSLSVVLPFSCEVCTHTVNCETVIWTPFCRPIWTPFCWPMYLLTVLCVPQFLWRMCVFIKNQYSATMFLAFHEFLWWPWILLWQCAILCYVILGTILAKKIFSPISLTNNLSYFLFNLVQVGILICICTLILQGTIMPSARFH